MARKNETTYVAITAFGHPHQDTYIAPGEVVNDLMTKEELEHHVAIGTVTVKGMVDDPGTWDENTAPPAAATVGELAAVQERAMKRDQLAHLTRAEIRPTDPPKVASPPPPPPAPKDPEPPEPPAPPAGGGK